MHGQHLQPPKQPAYRVSTGKCTTYCTNAKATETFDQYAEEVGLDIEKFKTDVASANVGKKISFDQALGKREGVSATPTFYLNGEKLDEETSSGIVQGDLTKIKAKLDELLK